jgi:hypothetical protein
MNADALLLIFYVLLSITPPYIDKATSFPNYLNELTARDTSEFGKSA